MFPVKKILARRRLTIVCIFLSILCSPGAAESGWKHLVDGYSISSIQSYEGGYWFSAGSRGALRYETATGTWYRYNKSSGHMNQSQSVNDLKIMHGKVWFATDYGLYSCNPDGSGWQQYILPGDYFANWVRAFDANSSHIWVASFSGLYTRPALGGAFTFQDIAFPGYGGSGTAYSVSAGDSLVWIGTENGLIRHETSLPVSNAASRTYFGKENGFNTGSQNVSCRALTSAASGVWIGLEEYTPSSNPTYCLGGLFNKQGDEWSKYDQSNGLPAAGIHFIESYDDKIYAGLFNYVNGVAFDGAGLLELNLSDSSLKVLNSQNWMIGNDDVRALHIDNGDTLVGTDEGLFTNAAALNEMRPYEAPLWFAVRNIPGAAIEITIDPVYLASEYKVWYSSDASVFEDSLVIGAARDTIRGFTADACYYFKVCGMNASGEGPRAADVLGCYVAEDKNPILIVQGFSKNTVGNTYDFIRQHGAVMFQNGYGFDSVSDDALAATDISPDEYDMMDWIAGLDEKSLTTENKNMIANYLERGGKLFISGAYIQENLTGSNADPYFYRHYLKAEALTKNSNAFSVRTLEQGIFDGIEDFSFGHSGEAAYQIYGADGFRPVAPAGANLFYSDLDTASSGVAGLQYKGPFAASQTAGALVYLGFPFETIYPDSLRDAVMASVLHYMDFDIDLTAVDETAVVRTMTLAGNYPNPFNAETCIAYTIPGSGMARLDLYDITGKTIKNLMSHYHRPGDYRITFQAEELPAGVYIYKLRFGEQQRTQKMLLLK